jgi:ribonucleoside-diphosphate reductase alpha chain
MKKIKKRTGKIVAFDESKIKGAVRKAFSVSKEGAKAEADKICRSVVSQLARSFKGTIPSVEDVQNAVEEELMRKGFAATARAYILYRKMRSVVRRAKRMIGVEDGLKLSISSIKVLERRYLKKDEHGRVAESPEELFRRVARAISAAEANYGSSSDRKSAEEAFFCMLSSLKFVPNSPTLMNAGTDMGQLSACFTLPVEDSIESIFETLKRMAIIHQSGGGTGFSFSRLRPRDDIVKSTQGVSSGPVSFMSIYDKATDVVRQGGRRRGANMGILRIDHPDILDFINCKRDNKSFRNFNISVAATDTFMRALARDGKYKLINPRSGKVTRELRAREVFEFIVTAAWECGDPGMIFIDEINRRQPTPSVGSIQSTNPCGEMPLLPYESCNLGSINLAKFAKDGRIVWDELKTQVELAVRFLDDVIDVNQYPLPEIREITLANRKIGLGVMGFADLLVQLEVPYDSRKALEVGAKLMKFISKQSRAASAALAEKRGAFPNFKKSFWPAKDFHTLRNATTTSIAPTGTISIIAGCSSGIEPYFGLVFMRNIMEGTHLLETNRYLEQALVGEGLYNEQLLDEIASAGSLSKVEAIPDAVKRLYVTSEDIAPDTHVRMQAAFQKYTDNAVSKTINLARDATVRDVERVYLLAHKLKCKGITIYRAGIKEEQPISWGKDIRVLPMDEVGGCSPERCFY